MKSSKNLCIIAIYMPVLVLVCSSNLLGGDLALRAYFAENNVIYVEWTPPKVNIQKIKVYLDEACINEFPKKLVDELDPKATRWRFEQRKAIEIFGLDLRIPSQWFQYNLRTRGEVYTIGLEVIYLDEKTQKPARLRDYIPILPFKVGTPERTNENYHHLDLSYIDKKLPNSIRCFVDLRRKPLVFKSGSIHGEIASIDEDVDQYYVIKLKSGQTILYEKSPNRPKFMGDKHFLFNTLIIVSTLGVLSFILFIFLARVEFKNTISLHIKKIRQVITSSSRLSHINNPESEIESIKNKNESNRKFDVFICHASEDKDFASPLVLQLRDLGLKVWYDDFELKIGDSLHKKIDAGLDESRYGVVILSPNFFKKNGWTQRELGGLIAKDKGILPIWHNVTKDDVAKYSPTLAGILAVDTKDGVENVVKEILQVFQPKSRQNTLQTDQK